MANETYICKKCGGKFSYEEMAHDKYLKNGIRTSCKQCVAKYTSERLHKLGVAIPYTELRSCSSFLGVHVAERLLYNVFKDVKRMPLNNRGYDFICNKGKKIDSKCSTMKFEKGHCIRWRFDIERNKTPDFFACIAFNNRQQITPIHFWLIPGNKINHLRCFCISTSTIEKWDAYKKPIDRMLECCNVLKGEI